MSFSIFPNSHCLIWIRQIETNGTLLTAFCRHVGRFSDVFMCLLFSDIRKLEMLYELNVSTNQLSSLPPSLSELPKLVILRAHSNCLRSLPDFHTAKSLRVIDRKRANVLISPIFSSKETAWRCWSNRRWMHGSWCRNPRERDVEWRHGRDCDQRKPQIYLLVLSWHLF